MRREVSHIIAISKCCLQKNYASGNGIVLSMLENLVQRHLHQSINRFRQSHVCTLCVQQNKLRYQHKLQTSKARDLSLPL